MPNDSPRLVEGLLRSLVAGALSRNQYDALRPGMEAAKAEDVMIAVDCLVAESQASGSSLESLKPAVAKLLNLLHKPLSTASLDTRDPLAALLTQENRCVLALLEKLRAPIAILSASKDGQDGGVNPPSIEADGRKTQLAAALEALSGIELHYSRLENVLFPWIEAHYEGWRCLPLMWSIHDDVRRSLKQLMETDSARVPALAGRLFFDVNALVFREERILYPVVMPLIGPSERLSLFREALALGPGLLAAQDLAILEARAESFAIVLDMTRGATAQAVVTAESHNAPVQDPHGVPGAVKLDAGVLAPAVIDAILKRSRLDMTFIDPSGRVAWFSNGPHRIFPRSPSIIGRDVRNCHPHESLGRVMSLIADFAEGRRDSEAFWIERAGRFIHIEYFAVKDAEGNFLGVLEASEDLTEKRALSGEKRLAADPA